MTRLGFATEETGIIPPATGTVAGQMKRLGAQTPSEERPFDPHDATVAGEHVPGGLLPPIKPGASGSRLNAGDTFGRYEVQREIARGGMGVVLHARDTTLRRSVALKLMLDETVSDDLLRRFLIEAEAGGRLTHPYICQVYDVGVVESVPYLTMELIDGGPINERAKGMAQREIAELMAQVGEGVGYAHRHGVVHRDLKPANVFVETRSGTPKIMDFGIAKVVDCHTAHGGLTVEGELMGTPAYMSPEQAQGRADVDARSDVYALGAILYELLTDKRTFFGNSLTEVLYQVAFVDPTPLRQIDAAIDWELEAIALKALEKDRARRYPDGDHFAADLRRYVEGLPIHAKQANLFYRLSKFVRRKRELVIGVGLALLVTLGSLGFFGYRWWSDLQTIASDQGAADELSAAADANWADFRAWEPGSRTTDQEKAFLVEEVRNVRERAIGHADKVLALDTDNPGALTLKARQEAGLETVRRELEDLVRAQTARETAAQVEAKSREEARRRVASGQRRLEAIDLGGLTSEAAVTHAESELKKALDDWIGALALAPNNPAARAAIEGSGETAQAIAAQRAIFKRRADADAAIEAGEGALAKGALRNAVTQFEVALSLDADNTRARAGRVEVGAQLAEQAFIDGNLDLVDYMLDELERIAPKRAAPLRERVAVARTDADLLKKRLDTAHGQRIRGEHAHAITSYREALRVDNDHAGARYWLAASEAGEAAAQGRLPLALKRWRATEKVAPDAATREEAAQAAARVRDALIREAAAGARAAIDRGDAAGARKLLAEAVEAAGGAEELAALRAEVEERGRAPKGFVYVAEGDVPFGPDPAPKLLPCPAFAMSRLEVTNREFAEFVRAGGYDQQELFRADAWAKRDRFRDTSGSKGPRGWNGGQHAAGADDLPVTGVSFFEAEAYARWRSMRLPTSLEWEKACLWDPTTNQRRATPWAASVEAAATLPAPWDAYFAREAPVRVGALVQTEGAAALNDMGPLGVENAYGNVHEWCADPGAVAVARGGSFLSLTAERAHALRTHARDPWLRHRAIGFRLAANVQR
ncbi:MAG: bifunctional serine/threonine-protein kinase/formylglycine-generating enzyme family protein [Planctomycetota bacterium]